MEIRRNNLRQVKGFTMLEFMVVMGVIGLLVMIAAPTYITMRKNVALNNESLEVLNALRVVQQRSMISRDNVRHGIHFNTNSYVIFGGDDYSSATYTETVPLENGLEFTSGSGSEIVFGKLTGTSTAGTVKVGYPGNDEKTIDVSTTGIVKLQ